MDKFKLIKRGIVFLLIILVLMIILYKVFKANAFFSMFSSILIAFCASEVIFEEKKY